MFLCREKNLEVSKKEAKAKEKKNEEKQAASKDDVDIDHEERLQEVRSIEPDTYQKYSNFYASRELGRKGFLRCCRSCRTMNIFKLLLLSARRHIVLLH